MLQQRMEIMIPNNIKLIVVMQIMIDVIPAKHFRNQLKETLYKNMMIALFEQCSLYCSVIRILIKSQLNV